MLKIESVYKSRFLSSKKDGVENLLYFLSEYSDFEKNGLADKVFVQPMKEDEIYNLCIYMARDKVTERAYLNPAIWWEDQEIRMKNSKVLLIYLGDQ